jgi:general secretion pathway protein K
MSRRSEEGIALIAVLWALTLLSLVAAALSFESSTANHISRNSAELAAARAAADAGIQRAMLNMLADSVKFRPDGSRYTWQFGDNTIHIAVRNEASKIDLNKAPAELLTALFASVGVGQATAQSLADATVDFRDPDDLPRLSGAEEADYQAAGLAWGPKNWPFETISEVRGVLGMSPEIYEQVAADLTIYPLGNVYSIRAEARGRNGATFVREVLVQLRPKSLVPLRLLEWRQGALASSDNGLEFRPSRTRSSFEGTDSDVTIARRWEPK